MTEKEEIFKCFRKIRDFVRNISADYDIHEFIWKITFRYYSRIIEIKNNSSLQNKEKYFIISFLLAMKYYDDEIIRNDILNDYYDFGGKSWSENLNLINKLEIHCLQLLEYKLTIKNN